MAVADQVRKQPQTFRFVPELVFEIEGRAERLDVSKTELVTRWVTEGLERDRASERLDAALGAGGSAQVGADPQVALERVRRLRGGSG